MRLTIQRLRIAIVALAVGLITVIALFFIVARYERHRLAHDLPAKLGIHIQSSMDGVTYSQSDKKGHVLFTIHASKVIQFKGGGRASLRDVDILLYGKQGDRADRIKGSQFEYDPVAGFARADGDVELELQGPVPKPPSGNSQAPGSTPVPEPDASNIHVKTSGLVFDKNTGIAHTDNAVEFQFPQASGKAIGATYDSSKGLLILGSAVEITSTLNGSPLTVRSSHAEFLRDSRQAFLLNVVGDYEGDRSISDQVILYFRENGSADHLDAKGNIHLTGGEGREITAQTGNVQFDEKSQPRTANLAGGILLNAQDAQHILRGSAVEGTLELGDKGTVKHARMKTSVAIVDQQNGLQDDPNGSATRQLTGNQVDVDFAKDENGKSEPSRVLAAGKSSIVLHTIHSAGPQQNTTLAADTLFANLGEGASISSLEGKGHTQFTDLGADGASRQSTGDALLIKFDQQEKKPKRELKTAAKGKTKESLPAQFGPAVIQSALQQGNVRITETPAKDEGKSAPTAMVATANQALYTGSDQVLRLEGSPRIVDGSLEMTAHVFEVSRIGGDASATGEVKATYQQAGNGAPQVFGGQGPVHIVSDKATLTRASGDAVFRGQARLWQGTNSITAPVIELSQTQQTLKAYGENGNSRSAVSGAFLTPEGGAGKQPGIVRLQSQRLLYSDAQRQATFSGSVVVVDDQATIRADEAVVVLAPVQAPGQKSSGLQSQVDHLVANGHVHLNQGERKGTGDKLVYTSQTGLFVLSGTAADPPRLTDPEHGTVTGDALIFNSRDDSVSVNGGKLGAVTETRVPR
jgi:lipopolysaccharide export system protein LptA